MLNLVALILVYLCVNFFLIIALGYLQTPSTQNTQNNIQLLPTHQQNNTTNSINSINSINSNPINSSTELCKELALAAICIQAFVLILVFNGTCYFPISAVFLALTILCHHAMIHRNSSFEGETCSCAPFQLKDVCNHETWVVASLVAALISWLQV